MTVSMADEIIAQSARYAVSRLVSSKDQIVRGNFSSIIPAMMSRAFLQLAP